MKSRDENYLTMVRNVIAVLNRYPTEWHDVKAFNTYVTALKILMADTDKQQLMAELEPKGYTENKHAAEEIAVDIALDLSSRAKSFARDQKYMDLYEQLDIQRRGLLKQHDHQILSKLNDVYDNLSTHSTELGDYGIEPSEMDNFRNAIDAYAELLDEPREKIVERKGYNTAANKNVPEIKELIEKMDNMMGKFKNTPFAVDYESARIVVDNSSRKKDNKEEGDAPNTKFFP